MPKLFLSALMNKKLLRCFLWLVSFGGILGTFAFLLTRLPDNYSPQSKKILSSSQNISKALSSGGDGSSVTKGTGEPVAPEWCDIGERPTKGLPHPVFHRFREWVEECKSHSGKIDSKKILLGVDLAKLRRAALKQLIKANPREALRQIVPPFDRKQLPEKIVGELSEFVTGVGNLDVLHACFGPQKGYQQTIFRTLRMSDGRKFKVFSYGQRSLLQEKRGLSVLGAAIDGELALLDAPTRILGDAESMQSGLPRDRVQVELCGEFLDFGTHKEAESFCRRARRLESRGGKVLNYEAYRASGQVLNSTTYQYQVLDVNLSWQNARIVAQGLGGDLAEINGTSERQTIAKLIGNSGLGSAWILNQENLTLFADEHNETSTTSQKGFVVEYPLTPFANASKDSNATVVRVLVIPARYKNQDTQASGQFGNFSPRTSREIYREMEATRTFYLRESNGRCRLDYNTTGTVTLPEDDSFYDWACVPAS